MRAPKYRDVDTGEVEVREVYKISSAGTIAGSLVTSGTIKRDGKVRVIRNGKQIADVKLATLRDLRMRLRKYHQVMNAVSALTVGTIFSQEIFFRHTLLRNTGINYGRISY